MDNLVKIVVTVPKENAEALRDAIGKVGAGKIGNYSYCSFTVTGIGRFIPEDGAKPTIGAVGKSEQVAEERIEVNCNRDNLAEVVAAIRYAHPYEEPAIDAYPLINLE